jgi:pimeloyl-ACP methyl ester carboxylesterase
VKRTGLILIFFSALMALPAAVFAADLSQASIQANDAAAECPYPIPAGEVVGETIVCGEVTVPENWANPGERMVAIGYAILKSPNVSPFPDPVIYLEGGPGSSALAGLPFLRDTFTQLREYRDVVIYDQPGNSYSSPLVCPLEIAGQPVETPDVDLDFVPTLDSDIVDLLDSAKTLGGYATAVNCAPYFAEQGVDLAQYSTANSVQDLIALMEALPYAEYNVYGISYGTNVALELFRYYTEQQGVDLPPLRSGVIDGNVPPNVDTRGGQAYATPNNILRLFDECEANPVCGDAFPDVRARAIALLHQAAEAPLEIGDETISVDDLRQVMGSAMTFKLDESNPDLPVGLGAAYLPLMVDELENGIADTFVGLRDGLLPPEPGESAMAAIAGCQLARTLANAILLSGPAARRSRSS